MAEIEISEADEVRARHLVPAATTMAMVPVVESRRKELARAFAEVRTAATTAERERIVELLKGESLRKSRRANDLPKMMGLRADLLSDAEAFLEAAQHVEKSLAAIAAPGGEVECFYVQNVERGYVGNNPQFWAKDGKGYTSYIDNAERFTEADALALLREDSRKWRVWSSKDVAGCIYRTVESQHLNRLKPVPQPSEARDEQ